MMFVQLGRLLLNMERVTRIELLDEDVLVFFDAGGSHTRLTEQHAEAFDYYLRLHVGKGNIHVALSESEAQGGNV